MDEQTLEAADRFIAAFTAISRWGAREFKRGHALGGLTLTQFTILSLLAEDPAVRTSQLAEHLELAIPTVVRALDALVRKGLVTRERDATNHREVQLRLTAEGKRVRTLRQKIRRERVAEVLSHLAGQDQVRLLRGTEAFARQVSKVAHPGNESENLEEAV